MNQYKWLLLDADNTLFDFGAAEDYALTRTLNHFGAPVTPEVKRGYKAGNKALWEAFEKGEISQEDLAVMRFDVLLEIMGLQGDPEDWNTFYLGSLADCSVLLNGAEQLCFRLSTQYTLALTTTGISYVQRKRLEGSPIARYFGDRVFISGEMGCRKPEKVYFDRVIEAIGARTHRAQVLVVGDSLISDIRGAFNARLDSLWLNRSGAKAGPIPPTYEVHTLAELNRFLTTPSNLSRK